jgi:hypothetical protein
MMIEYVMIEILMKMEIVNIVLRKAIDKQMMVDIILTKMDKWMMMDIWMIIDVVMEMEMEI